VSAVVLSLPEESCWEGDNFRPVRKEVVFEVTSIGKISGERVDHEFRADYAIYYQSDDQLLIQLLEEMLGGVEWGRFVYWRKIDQSGITIIDPDDDTQIGHIRVRRSRRRALVDDETNVVSIEGARLARALREADDAD
jgi:hypothetical protein